MGNMTKNEDGITGFMACLLENTQQDGFFAGAMLKYFRNAQRAGTDDNVTV